MERGRKQRTLPDGNDLTGSGSSDHRGQDLHGRSGILDPWSPDEHGMQWLATVEARELKVGFERFDLTAERVTPNGDVQPAQGLLVRRRIKDAVGQQDHSCTRAEHRQAAFDPFTERFEEVECADQFVHGRGFAAGQDERSDAVEFRGAANRHWFSTQRSEHGGMLADIALQGENPDNRLLIVTSHGRRADAVQGCRRR
jgi:hypothetical protein